MTTTIRDVMTPAPLTIGDDQPLAAAKHALAEHGIRHLPVLRAGRCVGILSDRDVKLAYAVEPQGSDRILIRDACNMEVYTILPTEPLKGVVQHMAEAGIGSAVIVDDRDKVLGIFTATDACRVLGETLA